MGFRRMKVGVVSLGCAKNQVDTEQMLALLTAAGYELTPDPAQAQVIIVNTCGFITSAKEESIDTILEMAAFKESGECRVLCVTGCLSERYRSELMEQIPEIDCILGVYQYDRIVPAIERALEGERVSVEGNHEGFLECGRKLTTPPYWAYVRIGEGCSNRCAYCAIPRIRGDYRSRPMESILTEMNLLAKGGAKEQILIAQDTSRWGSDNGSSLWNLMEKAVATPGLEWLRVLYMYPDEIDIPLLEKMAKEPKICKYLDLPLQHASPSLLKKMNRRGDVGKTRELLKAARDLGFTLRTTFIVGFPGETEKDFEDLMRFTEEIRFDRMGAFTYSPEEDTAAFDMPDQIDEEIKQRRLDELMTLQAEVSLERNKLRVGTREKVLVCGPLTGRSQREAPDADGEIRLLSETPTMEGEFVTAVITEADTYDLTARIEE